MSYILGLDLGVQSVGWAIIPTNPQTEEPSGEKPILGVRCFDSGTGTEQEIEQGKDESRNLARRNARSIRRNQWRRKRRTLKLFNILRNNGLLPMGEGPGDTPEERQALINELDQTLSQKLSLDGDRVTAHLLPYKLRAIGLDKKLEPHAFGRALLHLSQRRGFLSNKKAPAKDGEDEKGIKGEISDLAKEITEKGFRTLGEYFASLDPEEKRIRQRWTGRDMFKEEFELLWNTQEKKNPALTEELKKAVYHALFFQRPLKSQKHLIGKCQLEKGKRRAQSASMEAQRFRYWQKILDLKYRDENHEMVSLSPEQQDKIAEELEKSDKVTFSRMRELLGFKKQRLSKKDKQAGVKPLYAFNLEPVEDEKDKEKKKNKEGIKGNKTSARIMAIIPQWAAWPDEERDKLVSEILQFEKEDALARRLIKVYGFDANTAMQLANVQLERDYAKLSKQAIRKLLPVMWEKRISFATARKEIYGEQFAEDRKETLELLPPVLTAVKDLKNPVVTRTLTEVRKVVNAIIRQHGKPDKIRIELARDMKKSRKDREKATKEMKQQEKRRLDAKALLLKETGNNEPRPGEIQKILLAEECNWQCPYTGKTITIKNLSQFDIEHTLPFSRSLDNSFVNKTLCYHEENRNVKKNMTPFEAYSNDPQKWHEIMARVRNFRGPEKLVDAKLRRFQMKEIPQDFTSRMLNDTRYISKLACQYLGALYGGTSDANGKQRIQVSSGGMTAWLRDEWGMNSILNDGDEKNRNDHRHHAVDAAVIAMCDMGTVKKLSHAAERASEMGLSRRFEKDGIAEPVPNFKQIVSDAVDKINISFRANRKVSGGFHDETNYSPAKIMVEGEGKKAKQVEYRHVRKPIIGMTAGEVENIVDPTIRELVQRKLEGLGLTDAKKLPESELPYLRAKDGRAIPIKKARIRKTVSVLSLGKDAVNSKYSTQRHVAPGSNHHMEIFSLLDASGKEVGLDWVCVNLFNCVQRVRQKKSVISRSYEEYLDDDKRKKWKKLGVASTKLKFSLAKGEYVLATPPGESEVLCKVDFLSPGDLQLSLHTDARAANAQKETGDYKKFRIASLKKFGEFKIKKVHVDVLGNIHPATD